MKFLVIIHLFILIPHAVKCGHIRRLRQILPTTSSALRIIPRVEMPMVSTNSIQSGFGFKMPISVTFPSAMDFVQSISQTINTRNVATDSVATLSTNANTTRINSRMKLYKAIEKTHNGFGRVCLMRAICEVAEVPYISSSTGLIGEIFDMLLSSSILSDSTGLLSIYKEAENIGRRGIGKGDKCKLHFKECPLSLFNIVDIPFNG